MSVGFFKAGLLRTISSPDYPGQEGTKYYTKVQVQEQDFAESVGTYSLREAKKTRLKRTDLNCRTRFPGVEKHNRLHYCKKFKQSNSVSG